MIQSGVIQHSRNPGAQEWAAFFEARQTTSRQTSADTGLFGLWANAESAATQFGRYTAANHGAVPTEDETNVDMWATGWRAGVRWRSAEPTPADYLTPEGFIGQIGQVWGGALYDPTLPAPVVMQLTMYVYLGF